MKKNVLMIVFACLALAATGLNAADKKLELSIMPGYSMPQGDSKDLLEGAFGASMQAGYAVTDKLTAGLEAGYRKYTVKDSFVEALVAVDIPFDTLVSNDSDAVITEVAAFVKYYFAAEGWMPYVHLGAGLYASKVNFDITLAVNGKLTDEDSGSDFGAGFGLGVRKDFSDKVFGLLDLRYHRIFDEDDMSFLTPSVGVGFKF